MCGVAIAKLGFGVLHEFIGNLKPENMLKIYQKTLIKSTEKCFEWENKE